MVVNLFQLLFIASTPRHYGTEKNFKSTSVNESQVYLGKLCLYIKFHENIIYVIANALIVLNLRE